MWWSYKVTRKFYTREMFIYLVCVMLPLAVISKNIRPQAASSSSSLASSISMPICEAKEDCDNIWETPTISDCVDGLCHCTDGSSFSESKKTCECPEGFVIGRSKCLEVQNNPEGSCEEDTQCNNGTLGNLAVCIVNECHCSKGSVFVNGVCHQKKNVSEYCKYNEECSHVSNFACLDNVCACENGYIINPDDNSCMRKLQNMWDACIHDMQCLKSFGEGTVCRTKCICKSNYRSLDNVKCEKMKIDLGRDCSSSSECNDEGTTTNSTIVCADGKCVQRGGHSKVSSSTTVIFLMFLIASSLTSRNCCNFS